MVAYSISSVLPRGSQLLPRVYEILVILASKYLRPMGDSGASVRDSAVILASVATPSRFTFYRCNTNSFAGLY